MIDPRRWLGRAEADVNVHAQHTAGAIRQDKENLKVAELDRLFSSAELT